MPSSSKSRAWRLSEPTDGQLHALARHGVDPPLNATRGEVSDMLDHLNDPANYQRDDDGDEFNDSYDDDEDLDGAGVEGGFGCEP